MTEPYLLNKTINNIHIFEVLNERGRKQMYQYKCKCFCGNIFVRNTSQINSVSFQSCGCSRPKRQILQLEGQTINNILILEKLDNSGQYKCLCHCGKEFIQKGSLIKNGLKSCGCLSLELKDYSGQMINNILLIEKTDLRTSDRSVLYKCQCHCNKIFFTAYTSLIRNRTKSCGCGRVIDRTGVLYNNIQVVRLYKVYNNQRHWECICVCGKTFITKYPHIKESCGCIARQKNIMSCKARAGKNHHWYIHGNYKTNIKLRNSPENYTFRRSVFIRDSFQCINKCDNKNLVAHHINSFDWDVQNRTNIDNGITLCVNCHRDFHMKYGYGKNTEKQFKEWRNDS